LLSSFCHWILSREYLTYCCVISLIINSTLRTSICWILEKLSLCRLTGINILACSNLSVKPVIIRLTKVSASYDWTLVFSLHWLNLILLLGIIWTSIKVLTSINVVKLIALCSNINAVHSTSTSHFIIWWLRQIYLKSWCLSS
jgi:hypothetical protein